MARAGTTIIGKQLLRNNLKQGRLLFFPFNYVAGCQRGVTTEINPDWNYEEERRTFQLKTPEYYNFARDVIDQWAEKERVGARGITNPAFWWINESGGEVKWSFQDLSHKSKLVANVLTGPCKLKAGDLLIVMLPRIPEWWLINIAAIRAGIILSPGTILLRSKDIRHRINASSAKCVITIPGCAEYVEEVEKDCPSLQTKVVIGANRTGWLNYEDLLLKSTDSFQCVNSKARDPMTIFFTSGTTGPPKMTEHSHSSYGLGHLITARYWLQLSSNDVFWNLSDTGWAKSAWSSLFSPWIAGACVFAQDSSKFDPGQMLKVLHEFPLTHFCGPPTMFRFLIKEKMTDVNFNPLRRCMSAGEPVILQGYPIHVFCVPPTGVRLMQAEIDFTALKNSRLKRCMSGGEPVNPDLIEEWKEGTGLALYEGYGQTETTFICGTYQSIKQKPGSMGKPSPGIDLKIVDTEGNILPQGEEGEIAIRCKPERPVGLFNRYVDDEERMKRSFVGDFYLTGDRAVLDEEGYVHFVGRSDDVILSSGYRIGPFEVESALLEHPAVLESAVVSSPDPVRGEVVKAFITLSDSYKDAHKGELIAELQSHTKEITAPYKYPRKIEFVESLPKTVSNKIRRVELRNKEWGRSTEE